jgi:hypothetical protein
MQVMLFGKAPGFGAIVGELKKLEAEINSLERRNPTSERQRASST